MSLRSVTHEQQRAFLERPRLEQTPRAKREQHAAVDHCQRTGIGVANEIEFVLWNHTEASPWTREERRRLCRVVDPFDVVLTVENQPRSSETAVDRHAIIRRGQ